MAAKKKSAKKTVKKSVKSSGKTMKAAVKGIKAGVKKNATPKAPKASKAATHEVSCSSSSGCGGTVDNQNNLVNKPSKAAPEAMGDGKALCSGAGGCGSSS